MKHRITKIIAFLLAAVTLISVCSVSAFAYSYPMACTIYYKDVSGNTVAAPKTFEVDASTTANPSYSSPSVSGYVLQNYSDAVVSYSMMSKSFPASNYIRNGTATYTVKYVKAYTMTVSYLYTNGRQASSPKSASGAAGMAYSIYSPSVSGYTPDKTVVSGSIGSSNSYTTVYYYPIVYTLSYNANGGTGAPASGTISYGIGCGISYTAPTRTGYTFAGWSTEPDGSPDYQPGGFFDYGYANSTLYAIWNPNGYTVSYNANGGTGTPSSQTKYYGTTLYLSPTTPTRTGYDFQGWSTSSTGTTVSYSPGAAYTRNAALSLYALWKAQTYTISYNANGGTGAPSSQTKTYAQNTTLSYAEPSRSGYTFLGWSTSSTATTAMYSPGDSYSRNASISLYAVWKTVPAVPATYTVSYNANGGYDAPSAQTKTQGVTLTLSSTRPSRSGYTFMGWSGTSTATYATYAPGGSYYSNASITLYAVWQKNLATYYVAYNANGGTGAPANQTKTEGVTLTLSSVNPTREHYSFMGWNTTSTGTGMTYYPGNSYTVDMSVTLYAVWSYIPETYTVDYDENGGVGGPASQTKTENVTLTLSTVTPTKDGSTFLGWATSPSATVATYSAGGSFGINADTVLYAVWQNDSYDFSVSGLTITPNTVYQNETVTVKFRVDSWDKYTDYTWVPVEVLLNGTSIYNSGVKLVAYGVQYVTFTLNVGNAEGVQTVVARVNWDDHGSEKQTTNNGTAATYTVQKKMEFSASPVTENDTYTEGSEVISSFYATNDSSTAVTPSSHLAFDFEVYYLDANDRRVVVFTDTWADVVIPANSTNLVYFKWTVPQGCAGKLLWCAGTVNGNGAIKENNTENNTTVFNARVSSKAESQTPNTRYESNAPTGYSKVNPLSVSAGSATWNMWVYENGLFSLKTYGIRIDSSNPVVAPSNSCKTATYSGGRWTMKSGYGITLSWKPSLVAMNGYSMPGADSYTAAQLVYARFPEFMYSTGLYKYRTLRNVGGIYQFEENTDADGNERIHFIPVYVSDGDYTVSVTATQIWTPAGVISATRNANTLNISGTVYDDFYHG